MTVNVNDKKRSETSKLTVLFSSNKNFNRNHSFNSRVCMATFDVVCFSEQNVDATCMQDLAKAFLQVLGNEKASKQVYNISGEKYVTFDGIAKACAKV